MASCRTGAVVTVSNGTEPGRTSGWRHRLRRLKRRLLRTLAVGLPRWRRLFPGHEPLITRHYHSKGDLPGHSRLLILLPGIDDVLEDYELNGFIALAWHEGLAADMMVADLHFGYYSRRTALERLRHDVVLPARAQGYREIWLVGISLGGLGAALYAAEHPGDVTGLLLLAPYLGDKRFVASIDAAGGLKAWQPPEPETGDEDYLAKLWRWFKRRAGEEAGQPAIYIGFGDSDPFARANSLLAQTLPGERVFVVPGGHDWQTWRRLWQQFVACKREQP